jgi:hypothetical protein
MLIKRAAAILIAAFFMLATNGCYTHLKSPMVKLVPDEPETEIETTWDFDWGWAEPDAYNATVYYDYYYVPWWDDCSWCDENRGSSSDDRPPLFTISAESGKIGRREEEPIQPSVQLQPPQDKPSPTPTVENPPTSEPIVQPAQPSQGSDSKSTDSNSSKKIKRPGRR